MAIAFPGFVMKALPHFLWPLGQGFHLGSIILRSAGTLLLLPGLLTMAIVEGIVWVATHLVVAYHFPTSSHADGVFFIIFSFDNGFSLIRATLIAWLFYFVILSGCFRSEDLSRSTPSA